MPTIDATLVRSLLAEQMPQWKGQPVVPVVPGGWDHVSFRIGTDKVARFPRALHYAPQVAKEHRWLPVLGAALPLPIPTPLHQGQPGQGYPWPWSVYAWIDGQTAAKGPIANPIGFAHNLVTFLTALNGVDPAGGPRPGLHNFFRGGALATYNGETRDAIDQLGARIDGRRALALWERALATSYTKPPVCLHGDLSSTNLLVRDGRLHAVIDFGGTAVGDPACDLTIAWTFLTGAARTAFQQACPYDEPTWARARGSALWKALIQLAEQENGTPRRILDTLMAEVP
ncbi:MAG: aminoglycoside phosphotransferase family protein [Myxococcota bacterium]